MSKLAKLKTVHKMHVGPSKLIKQNTLQQTENKSHVDKSNDLSGYCSCESSTGHHLKASLLRPSNKEKLSRFVSSGHDTFEQNGVVEIGYASNPIQPRGPFPSEEWKASVCNYINELNDSGGSSSKANLNCSVQQRATRSSRNDVVSLKPHFILKVQGDGNGLYRSLSQLVFNKEHYFESIKKCILIFVQQKKNEGLFTKLTQDFEGTKFVPSEFVRKRVISSSFGGTHEDIFIFATLLQSPILVYCSNTTKWVQFNPMMYI